MRIISSHQTRFAEMSDEQLIAAFNAQVGNGGWTSARAMYLSDMRAEFLKRNIDCSVIGGVGGFSYKHKIRLNCAGEAKIVELES